MHRQTRRAAAAPAGARALIVTPLADAVAVEKYPPLDKTGNFKIAPATTWADVPAMTTPDNVPKGTVTMFTMKSEDTQMFPGVARPVHAQRLGLRAGRLQAGHRTCR